MSSSVSDDARFRSIQSAFDPDDSEILHDLAHAEITDDLADAIALGLEALLVAVAVVIVWLVVGAIF